MPGFEELKAYYESLSNVQLIELYLSGGFTDTAQSILNHELSRRGLDPDELNKEHLNTLLVASGNPKGIATLGDRHPLAKLLDRLRRIKSLATNHPFLFSLLIIGIHPLGNWIFDLGLESIAGEGQRETGTIHCLRALFLAMIYGSMLWYLDWLRAAGFLSIGKGRTWLWMAIFIVYEFFVLANLTSGKMLPEVMEFYLKNDVPVSAWLISPLAYFLTAALIEETICRGFILYCFLRLWGNSTRGIAKSVLVSSLIFGLLHIYGNVDGWDDLSSASFKVLSTSVSGIILCAFLLHGRSIWIPVVHHTLSNYIKLLCSSGEGAASALNIGIALLLIELPMILYGIIIVTWTEARPVVPEAP